MAVGGSGNQAGIVQQGATVTLTCTWDPGHPPHNHAFLERRGLELKAEVVNEDNPMQIKHVINDAQCEDSGQVYCKVAGTTANKSVSLLVLCEYEALTILVFWNEILHDKKRVF